MQAVPFLKTKYYPIDVNRRIIYNDPRDREGDCSLPSVIYRRAGTIGIKGERLNAFQCYNAYDVKPPMSEPAKA